MALTAHQLATIRAEIGAATPPTDDDLAALAAALGITDDSQSLLPVVRSVLRDRLATLLAGPASVTISGFYSESNGENMRTLTDQVKLVEGGGKELIVAGRLVRANRDRTFGGRTRL